MTDKPTIEYADLEGEGFSFGEGEAPDIRFFTSSRQVVVDDFPGFVDTIIEAVGALATLTTALQEVVDHLKVEDSQ